MARLPGALLLCLAAALPAAAQEGRAANETPLPLTTEPAPTIPRGAAVLEAYAELLDTPVVPFVSPEGSLLRAPVVSLRYGTSDNVEFRIEGAAQVRGFADNGEDEHEVGDFTSSPRGLRASRRTRRTGAYSSGWGEASTGKRNNRAPLRAPEAFAATRLAPTGRGLHAMRRRVRVKMVQKVPWDRNPCRRRVSFCTYGTCFTPT